MAALLATGVPIRLTHADVISDALSPQVLPSGHVVFVTEQSNSLRIKQNGCVDMNGARGPWARFEVLAEADSIRLKSVGHMDKHGASVFLEARDGGLTSGSTGSCFSLLPADSASCTLGTRPSAASAPAFALTDAQKAAFVRDGFVVLRGLVPQPLVDDALRSINNGLGSALEASPQASSGANDDAPLAHELGKKAAVRDLLSASPALGAAESLLGALPARFYRGDHGSQVALRFPLEPTAAQSKAPKGDNMWHIDGMKETTHMSGFQLLVGVALSPQLEDDCGNLGVWRGAHAATFAAVKAVQAVRAAEPAVAAASDDPWLGQRPALSAEGCEQVRMEPGDVVLVHQKTPHRIGLNRSPNIRYQVYFRLHAAGYTADAGLADVFSGWEGLHGHRAEAAAEALS